MIERDFVLSGVKIGEYAPFVAENVIDMINNKCIARGMNYISLSPSQYCKEGETELPEHYLYDWAKHCADNKIYFSFSGGGDRPTGGVNERKLKKIKEIAGDYFVAYNLSELGSAYACKGSGYHFPYTPRPWGSMQDAKDFFVNTVRGFAEKNSAGGVVGTTVLESCAMMSYECEAGISFPTFETLAGDSEIGTAFARGAQRAYNCDKFGYYIPHN